jgi:hypothetical protein
VSARYGAAKMQVANNPLFDPFGKPAMLNEPSGEAFEPSSRSVSAKLPLAFRLRDPSKRLEATSTDPSLNKGKIVTDDQKNERQLHTPMKVCIK